MEIKARIGMAKTQFGQLQKILTSRHISLQLRLRLMKCYVYSILLYGCETWTLNKDLEKRINAFEMWTLRRLGRISWTERKTNEQVCQLLQTRPELLETIKTRKLQYFGHTKRHASICKTILESKIEGKRQRGRPRRVWLDDIKDWTGRQLGECTRKTENRMDWRAISRRPLRR